MNSRKWQDEYSSDRPLEVGDCVVEWLDSDCLMEGCIRAIEPCELIGFYYWTPRLGITRLQGLLNQLNARLRVTCDGRLIFTVEL